MGRYGNSLLLNTGIISEKDLCNSITKLFCQHNVSIFTKPLESNGMVYKASSYSTNFCDGEAISKILIAFLIKWVEVVTKSESAKLKVEKILSEN